MTIFDLLRCLLIAASLTGSGLAFSNMRHAYRDFEAVRDTQGDEVVRLIARGSVDDQLRLGIGQLVLALAGVFSLFGPNPTSNFPGAWAVNAVFICLTLTSLIRTYMSYAQNRRRMEVLSLIRARRFARAVTQ